MGILAQRLNRNAQPVMYSIDGAKFQEFALSVLDYKGSKAHNMIGLLVTKINNNEITVLQAKVQYLSALTN